MLIKTTNYRKIVIRNKQKKTVKNHQRTQKENETQKLNIRKPPKQRKGRQNGKKSTEDEAGKPTRICKTSTICNNE